MEMDGLSAEDKEFLTSCEEEFKDRFTEKDEEFMIVFNREASTPPVIENWWAPSNSGRRNDRRHHRRPYDRYQNRDRQGRSSYSQRRHNDESYGPHRLRYSY